MLAVGARLGRYVIASPLGSGGMGEVYRARDTELGREVALKVLPDAVTSDHDRLKRFEREARVLAALSHPNVLTVFDVGRENGRAYLISECLDGATLEALLQAGRLSTREALGFGVQIARGLATAHARGVAHRDLKPQNLFVATSGVVKILDFGLAHVELPSSEVSQASTEASLTGPGTRLGTVNYMSPEQAKGGAGDTRSDIFSLGVVLFEMLGGRHPFRRESQPETLSAILRDDPPPLGRLQSSVPVPVEGLVRRCLAKRPEERFQTANDLALALEAAAAGAETRGRRVAPLVGLLGGCLVAVGVALGWRPFSAADVPERGLVHFEFEVEQHGVTAAARVGPRGALDGLLAMCPDGSCVVYRGSLDGVGRLFLRPLDRLTAMPIEGTERGHGPFFSPDGRWLAFFADDRLFRVLLEKPVPKDVAPAPRGDSGTFGPNGVIYFGSDASSPISRVSVDGGAVDRVSELDTRSGETSHRWPLVLPDGRTLIYESRNATGQGRILAQALADGRRWTVVEHGFHPRFVRGHLLFFDGVALKTAPIDVPNARLTGPTVDAVELLPGDPATTSRFDTSADGTLVWLETYRVSKVARQLWRVGRSGETRPFSTLRRPFSFPRFSPDGRHLAVTIREDGGLGVWVLDVTRQSLSRLTPSDGSQGAIWTPDGRRLTYASRRAGEWNLYSEPANGSGPVERLTTSTRFQFPGSWSPDGRTLAFIEEDPDTAADIRVLSRGEQTSQPLVNSPYGEWDGRLSPDGRLVAYASIESGRLEVYLRPVPGPGSKQQVSTEGGNSPVWSRNGKELFYLNGRKMMVAGIGDGPEPAVGGPLVLFEADYDFVGNVANYDVTPDGQAFVMVRGERTSLPDMYGHVMLNWLADLERRSSSYH